MRVEIFNLNTLNKIKWDKMAIEESNVCQTYEWAAANYSLNSKPLFLVVFDDNNNWQGGWLIFESKIPFFRTINIPSEPLIFSEKKEVVLDLLWNEIERRKPIYVNWLSYATSKWKDKQFLKDKGFNEIVKYGSHILDLNNSEEELWRNIHGKHRNVIRKATKERIIVGESKDIESYYYLSQETYKRSQARGPTYKSLSQVYSFLNPLGMCRVFFAKKGDKLVAGAFMLLCGSRVIYWHGATCNNPPTGASNLLHWEMIKKFKSEDYRWYDFGGASLNTEGKGRDITRFKERFGGKLEIFYGGYKIYSPLRKKLLDKIVYPLLMVSKYSIKPFKRNMDMQLRNKIFNKYYSVHGKFLGGEMGNRQKWFNDLCEANYAKHISPGGKILEIGCGKGYILKWLRNKGHSDIEGIDLSPEDVEIAKEYVGIDNIYCADTMEYLHTKEGIYDCIIGKDILLTIICAGAGNCWFECREILGVGIKNKQTNAANLNYN